MPCARRSQPHEHPDGARDVLLRAEAREAQVCAPTGACVGVCVCCVQACRSTCSCATARPSATDRLPELDSCSVCATDVKSPPVRRSIHVDTAAGVIQLPLHRCPRCLASPHPRRLFAVAASSALLRPCHLLTPPSFAALATSASPSPVVKAESSGLSHRSTPCLGLG